MKIPVIRPRVSDINRMETKNMHNQQETITAAEMLVRCLENEGVEMIFGIPGEENLDVLVALQKSSIRFITVRHEQGAAFMADVYGRLTHKAGVCLSTLGPGATNLITGVADANSDGAPLVAITGQVGTERMHLTTHQFLDLVELFKPITKRSKQIVLPDTVSEIVRIAFKYAQSEKPGACLIDLPNNIAKMPITPGPASTPIQPAQVNREYSSSTSVEAVAKLLLEAKSPVILVGHSAIRSNASAALTYFAQKLKLPVINTMMAKGIIPFDSPYSMGTVGIPQRDYQNVILDNADLVLSVGYDLVEFTPSKWNKSGRHTIVHIDSTASHIHRLYQPAVQVVGDISSSLLELSEACSRKAEPEEAFRIKAAMVKEFESYAHDDSFPLKPQRILNDVRRVMGREDIVICDVGAHKMWVARQYGCYEPNTCLISNGFATMGIGLPGAIAAKLIHPDRKILTITGDGGFLMNCQEMETAFRIGTPIVVLIFHDDSYGLIKWKEMDRFDRDFFVDFGNPDFVKFAESMHAKGYRIEKTEDLLPTLEEAFRQEVPVIIDCPVDYRENTKLSQHLKELFGE